MAIHYHQVMPKLMLYRRQLTVAVGVLGVLTIAVFGINRRFDRTIDQAQTYINRLSYSTRWSSLHGL